MTSPEILKRNLAILKWYDSGEKSRKGIAFLLNLSVDVVHAVIKKRYLYEGDRRADSLRSDRFPERRKKKRVPKSTKTDQ